MRRHWRWPLLAVAAALTFAITAGPSAAGAAPDGDAQARASPVTLADLYSAPVPALYANPAGTLQAGILPNPAQGWNESLRNFGLARPALGDLTHDQVNDAAAVVSIGQPGSITYDVVEVYTDGRRWLAQFNPAAVSHAQIAHVVALHIVHEQLEVDWFTFSTSPPAAWSAVLTWTGRALTVRQLLAHTTGLGLWSDPVVPMTASSLGGARLGMPLSKVQSYALSTATTGRGPGNLMQLISGGTHSEVLMEADVAGFTPAARTVCFDVQGGPSRQVVRTAQDFSLGESVARLKAVYGRRLVYLPPPPPKDNPSGELMGSWRLRGQPFGLHFIQAGNHPGFVTEMSVGHCP